MRSSSLLVCCVLLTCIQAFTSNGNQAVLQPSVSSQQEPSAAYSCSGAHEHYETVTREDHFGLDIASWTHLTILEQIDNTRWCLEGVVALVKGESDQEHAFEIVVKSKATSNEYLNCLEFEADKKSLAIRTTGECDFGRHRPWLHVDVVLAVRPHAIQFMGSGTQISTQTLPIGIWKGLYFETWNTTLHSRFGSIWCDEVNSFTSHEMSVAVEYGRITGKWSLPSVIALEVGRGSIDIELEPKPWSYGPSTKGDLIVKSLTGDINIRMPFEQEKLSLRNATTTITTNHGSIRAALVHGASTYVHTTTGLIDLTLLPYWAFSKWQDVQHNYITTTCTNCETSVKVLESVVPPYYETRPMYFANSTHTARNGAISLVYPTDWAGAAEWSVRHGIAVVKGDDFEVVRDDGRSGRLERLPMGSWMGVEVGNGVVDILMEGWVLLTAK